VLAIGVVLIPYPGPGWLIVFGGLAILATEFVWAQRVLDLGRRRYESWTAWLGRQHWTVRVLVLLVTALVVIATLWLLNTFGIVGHWLGLEHPWLQSPLF
jgi:uncharacterized protein (TIGR02611 family)